MKIRNNSLVIITGLFLFALVIPLSQVSANPPAMANYCIQPPFLAARVQPNVMLVLDNSGSMEGAAYLSEFDTAQFNSGHYYGYFDPTKNYRYTTSSTPSRWVVTTDNINTGTAANPIISGEILNWATMKRVDISKKLLIGGKASSGSYSASDRDTSPVKIYGHNQGSFNKDYVSPTSSPYNVYPFVGDYNYRVSGRSLEISPNVSGSFNEIKRPTSDITVGAWTASSGSDRWDMVDDTGNSDSDSTYIKNTTSSINDQIIFGYDRSAFSISGTIASVTINIRAKRVGSSTRRISGVLRMKDASTQVDYISDYESPGTSYRLYSFGWALNPLTGAAWTFADLTGTAVGSLAGFGVDAVTTPTSSKYPRVTQVYMTVTISNPSGTYDIIIDQGSTPARGILDTLADDVRFGLTFYNDSEGGRIPVKVGFNKVPTMVSSISDMDPGTWTPLSEVLRTVVSYYRQDAEPYGHTTDATGYVRDADGAVAPVNDPYFYAGETNQYVPCTSSYVLYLTDGESTQDQNMVSLAGKTTAPYAACSATNLKACSGCLHDNTTTTCDATTTKNPRYAGTPVGNTYDSSGTDYMIDVAYWARTSDARDKTGGCLIKPITYSTTDHCLPKVQNIFLYPVFLFGSGSTLLKDAAIYGGFDDQNQNGRPDCDTLPAECYRDSGGNPDGTPDGVISSDGTDDPITYYEGDDGYALQTKIQAALTAILRRTASGTAASVLASGEGSGANLLQSIFYPRRSLDGQSDIYWTSTLMNLWYGLDKGTSNSTIRENTADTVANGVMQLNLDSDYIINLWFDTADQTAKAKLFADSNADGLADTPSAPAAIVEGPNVKSLWEAGLELWNTPAVACATGAKPTLATPCRNIFANVTNTAATSTAAFAGMTAFRADATVNNLGVGSPTLQTLLNTDVTGRSTSDKTNVATDIVNYIRGVDPSPRSVTTPANATISYRNRTTGIDLSSPKNGTFGDTYTIRGETWDELPKVWKLGDIVNSTQRVVSWIPLGSYHTTYGDTTYSTFINSSTYKNRGMVFAGANDGMLHAFKLGTLDLTVSGNIKAKLCEDDGAGGGTANNAKCESGETNKGNLGKERWAFIPKNVLPYLQYLADPAYCHLYYVDASPFVFDASIEAPGSHTSDYWTHTRRTKCGSNQTCTDANNTLDMANTSWRTILIGGMREGGACKNSASSYQKQTPATDIGYSSYFALDITDPESPQFLWEFSDPNLGFSTSGPAIVKINARNAVGTDPSAADTTKNGKWFVVFASGPTGPIGTSQFRGYSDQSLKLFVLDLKTGQSALSSPNYIETGIQNAFGGSLNNATFDFDFDAQDDALYLGYTKAEDDTLADNIWNKGGVLRLITREDLNGYDLSLTATAAAYGTALNPANWRVTKVVDNIGAVTSTVSHIAHYPASSTIPDKAYLYFGTGRFFYPADDSTTQQALYGVVEPCLSKILDITTDPALSSLHSTVCDENGGTPFSCTTTLGVKDPPGIIVDGIFVSKDLIDPASCLENATTTIPTKAPNGWYINLDAASGSLSSERVITEPVAAGTGAVFFTSFAPDTDICAYGGATRLWAVKYDTAAAVAASIKGIALLQVSTGNIEQVNLRDAFGTSTDATHKYGRRTDDIPGVPPIDPENLTVPPKPINKFMHVKER